MNQYPVDHYNAARPSEDPGDPQLFDDGSAGSAASSSGHAARNWANDKRPTTTAIATVIGPRRRIGYRSQAERQAASAITRANGNATLK